VRVTRGPGGAAFAGTSRRKRRRKRKRAR
jgi:hypothetical protein